MAANQCQQNYKMSDKEIKVPNIGEFKDVEVIEVLVSSGQSVSKNDPLITIESDKSSVEIPASFDGKVKSVKIKVGDRVSEGDLILTVEQSAEEEKSIEQKTIKEAKPVTNQNQEEKIEKVIQTQNLIKKDNSEASSASPKVRKFARELGVNIKSPSETLSPTLILTDLTFPLKEAGISTLDLSLSIVISGSFLETDWPLETNTSITSTSLNSPIFGTLISLSDIL